MLISEGPISKASCVQLPATKPCYVMVINRTVTKNALITSNNQCSMVVQEPMHGRRKDFSRGATRVFFQNFSRGPKVVKFVFSHSKSRKHRFFAEIFKIQRRSLAPLPPLFDAYELMFCPLTQRRNISRTCHGAQYQKVLLGLIKSAKRFTIG